MAERHISTTALARLIGKESKELFILLTTGGWIVKVDNHWQLTEKGKFEGGIYVNHPKYGEYIAWPESIQHHPLLKLLPEAPLSASNLAHKWEIPARLVNLLLAEKGLIKKHIRGWLLTPKGKAMGGAQHEAAFLLSPGRKPFWMSQISSAACCKLPAMKVCMDIPHWMVIPLIMRCSVALIIGCIWLALFMRAIIDSPGI
jgi:hypothetical protein